MKINKSLNIDLNIISPQKHIRIHEGDVDSVDILIGVTVDDESVDLDGVTIKYDATINNYLAEQDADGSVVDGKISIPVTQNMTAMSGLLLIDVRMIQNDQILFTQTICATVEKAVVNGSTYIDFDKITIVQRMNALEEKMDYIEELVENFDTSKLIVSTNRPPSGAPAELDVDLLRVGDTWILSGASIVYKLVEAQYNYQPVSSAEPYHKFTWQPLNERYGVGNTEPPTTVTYQAVIYTINEVQWSWLPVPEYFKGDHFQMQIGVDDPTYYICKSASMPSTGVCTYTWREEGGSIDAYTKAETNELLADKMDLAPLNPTAEQIAALPVGQLYSDTVNHKGTIKGGQSFYDTEYIDEKTQRKIIRGVFPIRLSESDTLYEVGDLFLSRDSLYILLSISRDRLIDRYYSYGWERPIKIVCDANSPQPPSYEDRTDLNVSHYRLGDFYCVLDSNNNVEKIYRLKNIIAQVRNGSYYRYTYIWDNFAYTKTEVDSLISAISTLSFEVVQSKPVSDIKTNVIYLVPKSTAETNNVYEEWIYVNNAWELIGSTEIDLSNYMALAPLNPAAQEIEDMPSGQLYGDTTNHKGVIKGGQEFYDTTYVDDNFDKKFVVYGYRADAPGHPSTDGLFPLFNTADKGDLYEVGQRLLYTGPYGMIFSYILEEIIYSPPNIYSYLWGRDRSIFYTTSSSSSPQPPTTSSINTYNDKYGNTLRPDYLFYSGDIFVIADRSYHSIVKKVFVCASSYSDPNGYHYTWEEIPLKAASLSGYGITDAYTKTEINEMIGDIETALSEV